MKRTLFFVSLLLCFPLYSNAQAWSGILSPSRATNWSQTGVEGGIPSASWTQCGSTIAAYSGSGQAIQTAIDNCSANHYVQLGAGTFTLSSGFTIDRNAVAVRGMGADQTFLIINGDSIGPTCGYNNKGAVKLCASYSAPQSSGNWTAGYSQGTTTVTLDNTSGITTGSLLMLDQLDDPPGGYPSSGDVLLCNSASSNCSALGSSGYSAAGTGRDGRSAFDLEKVTAVLGGGQFAISPPISLPTFRSGQSPGYVYDTNIGDILQGSGLEDLSVDFSGITTGPITGVEVINTEDCWVKGVRIVYTANNSNFSMVLFNDIYMTLLSNYIYNSSTVTVGSYPIEGSDIGASRIENNICQGVSCDLVTIGPMTNTVFSYNFTPGHTGPAWTRHGFGETMNLVEGNITMGAYSDVDHGTSAFNTFYRNAFTGNTYSSSGCYICNAVHLESYSRFYNFLGNVLGYSGFTKYQNLGGYDTTSIYDLNWGGSASGDSIPNDSNVSRTLMRWGNWDNVTGATRWCGNSSDTGWSTTCGSTSEVPSTIASFPNSVPTAGDTGIGQSAMPSSLYLSLKPNWWPGSIPWPAIGPDITGGNIPGTGGHAYLNPAANCYLNVMKGSVNGSGGPLSFNAGTCYPQGQPPVPPTGLVAIPH